MPYDAVIPRVPTLLMELYLAEALYFACTCTNACFFRVYSENCLQGIISHPLSFLLI